MTIYNDEIKMRALECGYTDTEIAAGLEFQSRKSRKANPPGCFDKAGRFYADEETQAVRMCRTPSRAFPYSQMQAARTAGHCAEVFAAERLLAVKRVAVALDRAGKGDELSIVLKALKVVKREPSGAVEEA